MTTEPSHTVEPTERAVASPPAASRGVARVEAARRRGEALRRAHLIVGLVFLGGFLLTGQYMHWALAHLQPTPGVERMLYRSTHIYLLWSALLNVALGLYLRVAEAGVRRAVQGIGSVAILGGPLLLAVAFFREPTLTELARPLSRPAIYSAFGGLLLHVFAAIGTTRDEGSERTARR